jgi:hypothetical protein
MMNDTSSRQIVLQEDGGAHLLTRLVHAVRGCRPVPRYAVRGRRIVPAGRVCPVCWAESPDV